jgi:RimJ/RimL family protein N-acetyltransferase
MKVDAVKPSEIIVNDFILKMIPATNEYAQQIFDIFQEDPDGFKYWLEYSSYKNADEVLEEYKHKYTDKGFCKYAMYGIFKNGELLGEIGLGCIYTRRQTAEVGFWLKKSARGCGIIDLLLPKIEKLAFETYDLHKLTIWCDNDNIPVKKHAEKHNYIYEGCLREENTWEDGSHHSIALYGKLKQEWKK